MELNDDCLLTIFEFLSLKDQISAAHACPRFYNIISFLWQRKYTKYSEELGWDLTRGELTVLLHSICESVKEIDIYTNQWRVIKLFSYPKLRTLTGYVHRSIDDYDLFKMTQIFPNLREFKLLGGNLSGKYMEKWRYLDDLDVPEGMQAEHFEKILEETQLKKVVLNDFIGAMKWKSSLALQNFLNLEKIGLFSAFLKSLPYISRLKNLKVLELYHGQDRQLIVELLTQIAEHKYDDLTEMIVKSAPLDGKFPLRTLFVRKFMNLRKLSVSAFNSVSDIIEILKWIPNLREITLMHCTIFQKEHLYSILSLCPQIELINLEGCFCDFALNANYLTMNRTTLLHLNIFEKLSFYGMTIDRFPKENIEGENSLFKFTSEKIVDCDFSKHLFRFH